jgi:hypothetical protein
MFALYTAGDMEPGQMSFALTASRASMDLGANDGLS